MNNNDGERYLSNEMTKLKTDVASFMQILNEHLTYFQISVLFMKQKKWILFKFSCFLSL